MARKENFKESNKSKIYKLIHELWANLSSPGGGWTERGSRCCWPSDINSRGQTNHGWAVVLHDYECEWLLQARLPSAQTDAEIVSTPLHLDSWLSAGFSRALKWLNSSDERSIMLLMQWLDMRAYTSNCHMVALDSSGFVLVISFLHSSEPRSLLLIRDGCWSAAFAGAV